MGCQVVKRHRPEFYLRYHYRLMTPLNGPRPLYRQPLNPIHYGRGLPLRQTLNDVCPPTPISNFGTLNLDTIPRNNPLPLNLLCSRVIRCVPPRRPRNAVFQRFRHRQVL